MLRRFLGIALTAMLGGTPAAGQKTATKPPAPPAPQSPGTPTKGPAAPARVNPPAKKPPDPETELNRAIEDAGNDRAALVRNLENFLRRFPEAPRKLQVYRALVESAMQLRDTPKALNYAERIIALRPEDASMMLFAVELLERAGDDQSLVRAVGYTTRVLDRVEKAGAEAKPARISQAEWEAEQKKLLMSVYLIRGRLQLHRRAYGAATTDLEASYRLLPNAAAAMHLGEIAELHQDRNQAIEHYVAAFTLPDQYGLPVDRWEVRRKLGNLWQLVHGNEAGLGERLLQAYDKFGGEPKPGDVIERNKGVSDLFGFVLRRPDGSAPLKLADSKGKVLVLNFWATWCLPCRELEPLFEQVGREFEGKNEAVFLAVNGDEDESRVKPFLDREKMRATVVFSDGLGLLLDIKAYPTIIVLDATGKIVYRSQGFAPEGFVEALSGAIHRALAGAS
ncbi:MAG: redoxin family protein [Acidobacteria bacterium]|nr:redoxin family protein [Acidobacteriota bacterium]